MSVGGLRPEEEEEEQVTIQTEVTYSTSFYAHYFTPTAGKDTEDIFRVGAASCRTPASPTDETDTKSDVSGRHCLDPNISHES